MWTEEDYWQKSRLYIRRAQSAGGDDSLYPFWMSLALEFIARAALSKVSPVLNADVRDVENIYFALGLTEVGTPKTIPLHSVFGRCVTVVDGFEGRHKNFCGFLGTQRNEELHTGSLPFENLKLQDWLQSYYEVLDILCRHLRHSLEDILGEDEAASARALLQASAAGLESSVKQEIADRSKAFDAKPEEQRQQLRRHAQASSLAASVTSEVPKLVDCPACSSMGLVEARPIRRSRPYFESDMLLEEVTASTQSFSCAACGLRLPSASHVRWSDIEPQFTVVLETSLHELQELEYYNEYMNE